MVDSNFVKKRQPPWWIAPLRPRHEQTFKFSCGAHKETSSLSLMFSGPLFIHAFLDIENVCEITVWHYDRHRWRWSTTIAVIVPSYCGLRLVLCRKGRARVRLEKLCFVCFHGDILKEACENKMGSMLNVILFFIQVDKYAWLEGW